MPPRARKEPTAADTAVAEATDAPLKIVWRDIDFLIPQDVLGSAAVVLKSMDGKYAETVFMILSWSDPAYPSTVIDKLTRKDSIADFATEFIGLLNAAGPGNSSTS